MGGNDTKQFYESLNEDLTQFYEESSDPLELLSSERYTEHEFIAEGSIKNVYKVFDTFCSRNIAMARIRSELIGNGLELDFVREVQLTASMEHPNIARIYDVGVDNGNPYFTMELVEGEALDQWLSSNPDVLIYKKLDIFREVCDAVEYAHDRGILHLDIKPSNILIGERDRVTLMDWGISYYVNHTQQADGDLLNAQTLHGYIKGTPGFMAPEQAELNYVKSVSADVFGLAATLYYMLSGRSPFDGDHINAVISNSRWGKLKNSNDIPAALFSVLKKALMPLPGHRFDSVADLKQEVENFQSGFATYAERTSMIAQTRLFIQRNKYRTIAVLIFIFGIIGLNFYYVKSLKIREKEAQLARKEAVDKRNKLRDAIAALKSEQKQRKEVTEVFNYFLEKEVRNMLDNFQFDEALKIAKAQIQSKPGDIDAIFNLGFVHFIMQKYNQAYESFRYVDKTRSNFYKKVCLEYKSLNRPLNAEETNKLFKSFGASRKNLRVYFFVYNGMIKPVSEHIKLVQTCLFMENQMTSGNFGYDPVGQVLDISANPQLKKIEIRLNSNRKRINIFRALELKQLDVSGTKISNTILQKYYSKNRVKIIKE